MASGVEVITRGFDKSRQRLEARHARIVASGSKATGAYANVIAKAIRVAAPKRKRLPSAKAQARKSDASQWSRSPEPLVRANLRAHVKVYPEAEGRGNVSATAHKIRLTGRVWHLILGPVKEHEIVAGTFRGKASGRKALQMLDGYAVRAMHPAQTGLPHWLGEVRDAARPEAALEARKVLSDG